MNTLAIPVLFADDGFLDRDEGAQEIARCLATILSTEPEELEAHPAFGSRVPRLVLEPNDAALAREIVEEAGAAIGRWERRALFRGATVTVDPATPRVTRVEVRFKVRAEGALGRERTTGVDLPRGA